MQTLPQARHANLHFVTPHLAIGGDLDYDDLLAARQLTELGTLGISHLVDCRIEADDTAFFADYAPHLSYLHHGMDDAGQAVPASWFDRAIDFIDSAGPDAVVLTHCHMGINRGPSLGFAVLLYQGRDPVEALAAIRAVRPIANIWYADDAVRWHADRHGYHPADALRRVEQWRQDNPLDVVRIIREGRVD